MTEPAPTTPTDSAERPARRAHVRIPTAILAAFVLASVVISAWAYIIGAFMPDAIDDIVAPLLLFALAPVLAGLLARGSRTWVRVAIGIFAAWLWVFWLFLVLVPITST